MLLNLPIIFNEHHPWSRLNVTAKVYYYGLTQPADTVERRGYYSGLCVDNTIVDIPEYKKLNLLLKDVVRTSDKQALLDFIINFTDPYCRLPAEASDKNSCLSFIEDLPSIKNAVLESGDLSFEHIKSLYEHIQQADNPSGTNEPVTYVNHPHMDPAALRRYLEM